MKYLLLLVAVGTASATAHGMPPCSPSQGWTLVGTITSDSGCPAGLAPLTACDKELCGKTGIGCSSVTFPTNGVSYSKVSGLVYGYQQNSHDAFFGAALRTIDQPYIDGVSITHGSPRQHIWTLAATTSLAFCPRATGSSVTVPPYVGTDYFCDVSSSCTDRLWDGAGSLAGDEANCFYKVLPQPTTDDIEFRVCTKQNSAIEDVYIEYVKIYIHQ